MTAQQFVEAGADEIQHINMVFLNFFFDEVKDTRTPARFIAVAERGATLDLSSERVRSFVQLLKDRNVVLDPTLTVFEGLFTDRPGKISPSYAAIADRLPPQVRRGFLAGGLPVPEGKDARYRESQRATVAHDEAASTTPGFRSSPARTGCRASLCIASSSCTRKRASVRQRCCVSRRSVQRESRAKTKSSARSRRASWRTWCWWKAIPRSASATCVARLW